MAVDEKGKPNEVFFIIGKAGACARAWSQAMGKLLTNNIRNKMQVKRVIKQFQGIDCHGVYGDRQSCPDAIASVLEGWLDEPDEENKSE